jgi:NAD-dependent SIR2 family protein deacetylase
MAEQTDRNVFLLGAGFSKPAGAPLMCDFLDRSRQFLKDRPDGLDEYGLSRFRKVFEFRYAMSKAKDKIKIDLDNIEELFGLIEMSYRLGSIERSTRDSVVYTIVKTLELCIHPRAYRPTLASSIPKGLEDEFDFLSGLGVERPGTFDKQHFLLDMYELFALMLGGCFDERRQRESRKNVVVTLNYDLVLDDALRQVGIQPWYGHDSSEGASGSVSILKLHGSANWLVCNKCEKPVVLDGNVARSQSELDTLSCPCGGRASQPLLVPPWWDKNEYRNALKPVWQSAVKELKSATRICVIGYSLPESDAFFRYLITLALSENHQLEKLIVVDQVAQAVGVSQDVQNKKNVEEKWDELLEPTFRGRRFSFYGSGLQGYLCNGNARRELGRAENLSQGLAGYGSI